MLDLADKLVERGGDVSQLVRCTKIFRPVFDCRVEKLLDEMNASLQLLSVIHDGPMLRFSLLNRHCLRPALVMVPAGSAGRLGYILEQVLFEFGILATIFHGLVLNRCLTFLLKIFVVVLGEFCK